MAECQFDATIFRNRLINNETTLWGVKAKHGPKH